MYKLESEIPQTDFPQCESQLVKVLTKYRDTVALTEDKLGRTNVTVRQIVLERDSKHFTVPDYRLPVSQRDLVDEMTQEIKEDGVVSPSMSPYNSPLLLVSKKDWTFCLVIDHRKLNAQTIQGLTPMPVINDVPAQ